MSTISTSSTQMNLWKAVFIVFLLIVATIVALWIISQFIKSDIALGAIGFAGAIATASIQYRTAKEKEAASRLFSEKQKVYSELVTLIMNLFSKGSELAEGPPSDELVTKLQEIRTKLIIWGSYDTVRALDRMGEAGLEAVEDSNPAQGLVWLAELMTNVRKDLGHKDPKAAGIDMAVGMIKPDERAKIREMINQAIQENKGK